MMLGYFMSGSLTIFSHACIFTSLGGIIIVIYKLIKRETIHKYEIIGTIISLVGCVITIFDPNAAKVDPIH
jgi:drug/metabolite transporter (DMT)-like permease